MKRRDLIRSIAGEARPQGVEWQLLRQGGSHEVYALNGTRISIPRHSEVNEKTAQGILKEREPELGERWGKP